MTFYGFGFGSKKLKKIGFGSVPKDRFQFGFRFYFFGTAVPYFGAFEPEKFRILLFSVSANRNTGHHPFKSERIFYSFCHFSFAYRAIKERKKFVLFFLPSSICPFFFLLYEFICVLFRLQSSWLTYFFSELLDYNENQCKNSYIEGIFLFWVSKLIYSN
jgi:hypothetical protein